MLVASLQNTMQKFSFAPDGSLQASWAELCATVLLNHAQHRNSPAEPVNRLPYKSEAFHEQYMKSSREHTGLMTLQIRLPTT